MSRRQPPAKTNLSNKHFSSFSYSIIDKVTSKFTPTLES